MSWIHASGFFRISLENHFIALGELEQGKRALKMAGHYSSQSGV
jgi:hypothetical protein